MENPEFSHYEDASYRHTVIGEEVTKGEQVGGDTPQKHNSDLISDLDGKKLQKKDHPTVPELSIAEMQKLVNTGKNEVERVAGMNPDWPPGKGNPEAENQLAGNLEQGYNGVA